MSFSTIHISALNGRRLHVSIVDKIRSYFDLLDNELVWFTVQRLVQAPIMLYNIILINPVNR